MELRLRSSQSDLHCTHYFSSPVSLQLQGADPALQEFNIYILGLTLWHYLKLESLLSERAFMKSGVAKDVHERQDKVIMTDV